MALLRKEIRLSLADVSCLLPGRAICGEVITAYLRCIERRCRSIGSKMKRVWALDTLFLRDWDRGGYQATRKRAVEVDLFEQDILLVPLHHPREGSIGHWSLVVVEPQRNRIRAYDSLGGRRRRERTAVLDFLQALADETGKPFKRDLWETAGTPTDCPKQTDKVSCGVYVCAFAEKVSRRGTSTHWEEFNPETYRRVVSGVLRRGRFDSEEFEPLERAGPHSYGRYALSRSACTPPVTIDIATPSGEETVLVANDPLLEAIDEELRGMRLASPLFPPLVRTPQPKLDSPIAVCVTETTSPVFEKTQVAGPSKARPEPAYDECAMTVCVLETASPVFETVTSIDPLRTEPKISEEDPTMVTCVMETTATYSDVGILDPVPTPMITEEELLEACKNSPEPRPSGLRKTSSTASSVLSLEARNLSDDEMDLLPSKGRLTEKGEIDVSTGTAAHTDDEHKQKPIDDESCRPTTSSAGSRTRSRHPTMRKTAHGPHQRSSPGTKSDVGTCHNRRQSRITRKRSRSLPVDPEGFRVTVRRRSQHRLVEAQDGAGRAITPRGLMRVPDAVRRGVEEFRSHMTRRQRRNRRYRVWHADGTFTRVRPRQVSWLNGEGNRSPC